MKSVTAKSSARQVVSDVKEPEFKRVLNGHIDQVLSAAFTSSIKQLVSSSLDNTVMVWNLKQNMYPWKFTGHTGPAYTLAYQRLHRCAAPIRHDVNHRFLSSYIDES